jgi:colicin import membrane protein
LAERTRLDAESLAAREQAEAASLAERSRLEQESADRITTAEDDFEITLRKRRSDEHAKSEAEIQAAHDEARRLVEQARADAERREHDAADEVARLRGQRDRVQDDLAALHERLAAVMDEAKAARASTDSG